MSNYTRLFIDGKEVDLINNEDLPISFTLRITASLENSRPAGGNSKKNIDLPSTENNLNIFNNWHKNIISDEQAVSKKPFFIQVNGVQVLEGTAQLQESVGNSALYGRGSSGIKVLLLANNADWITRVKDLRLIDLDWTDTNRQFDDANVTAGWNASVDTGEKVAFPLVKWKEWNTPGEVAKSEFTPAIFILDIINKIFNSVGYTIQSSFLNSDLFKSLVLLVPVGQKYNERFAEDLLNIKADLQTPIVVTPPPGLAAVIDTTIVYDNVIQDTLPPSPYNNTTGIYTVPYNGFYQLEFTCTITDIQGTAGLVNAEAVVYVNGAILIPGGGFTKTTINQADLPVTLKGNRVIQVNAGDLVEIRMIVLNDIGVIDYTFGAGTLQIIGEADAGFNTPLFFEYLLNDWTAKDILQGITDIYNLRFETDVNRQVITIEPAFDYLYSTRTPDVQELRQGFYISNQNDLSQRVDLSKESRVLARNNTSRIQQYTYEQEGDTERFINAEQPQPIYAARFDLGANRFEDATQEKKVAFFVSTIHTWDKEISEVGSPPVQIPLIYPQNYVLDPTATVENFEVKPRILHFFGQRSGIDGRINVTTDGLVDVPACFFTNYNDPTGNDPSLSFGNQSVSENIISLGLVRRFFLWDLTSLQKGKDIDEFIFWDSLDILQLSFRNTILLEKAEFILQEINNYNPLLYKSIKTKLTFIFPPSQAEADKIDGAITQGLANLTEN